MNGRHVHAAELRGNLQMPARAGIAGDRPRLLVEHVVIYLFHYRPGRSAQPNHRDNCRKRQFLDRIHLVHLPFQFS